MRKFSVIQEKDLNINAPLVRTISQSLAEVLTRLLTHTDAPKHTLAPIISQAQLYNHVLV